MILTLYSVGTLESVLYKEDSFESYHDILKFLIVMSMFLIIFLVMRMILIKEKIRPWKWSLVFCRNKWVS